MKMKVLKMQQQDASVAELADSRPAWPDLAKWLSRRLPAMDGRFHSLSEEELRILQQDLEAAQQPGAQASIRQIFTRFLNQTGLQRLQWMRQPRPDMTPLLACGDVSGLLLLHGQSPGTSTWIAETPRGRCEMPSLPADLQYCSVALGWREKLSGGAVGMFADVLLQHKKPLAYFALASLWINLLALLTSLFSMQVYDRVIPSHGIDTLWVLTVGVSVSILFELVLKFLRSSLMDRVVVSADCALSHRIFERLLRVRMDQFPATVGTLASQLRSYEMIRAFAYSAATYLVIDTPFALIFWVLILMISGPGVALIPLAFFVVALLLGLTSKSATERHARQSQATGNKKLGLLVEAVECAESIKAQGWLWHFLNRWNLLTRENVQEDRQVRHITESSSYWAGTLQQLSYVLLVASGAYIAATSSELTSGGLIACSILSGRVLQPVTLLPGLLMQWANAKTALNAIDGIFKLQMDHHEVEHPLSWSSSQGGFELEQVSFAYAGQLQQLQVPRLSVKSGERVGVIGSIGSGKSTLLKVLAGLYRPQEGRVLLDHLDIQQISREHLSQKMGCLSQTVQLFSGTLRDNLVAGLVGVDEQLIHQACIATGLQAFVHAHPKGLELPINEGGGGVSGGQRQLIGLTRLLLMRPSVWLLDEPTSSMDEAIEHRAIQVLQAAIQPGQTLVVVTHKPAILPLVDRLIVMANGRIALDGPRDAVLEHLRKPGDSEGTPA